MSDINLDTFPSNYSDALVMLYLQNCDLKGKSISDILSMYTDAKTELRSAARKKREDLQESK